MLITFFRILFFYSFLLNYLFYNIKYNPLFTLNLFLLIFSLSFSFLNHIRYYVPRTTQSTTIPTYTPTSPNFNTTPQKKANVILNSYIPIIVVVNVYFTSQAPFSPDGRTKAIDHKGMHIAVTIITVDAFLLFLFSLFLQPKVHGL